MEIKNLTWEEKQGFDSTVMRQDDNGKGWHVRVEDVLFNRFDIPVLNSGKWYEPESTIADLDEM